MKSLWVALAIALTIGGIVATATDPSTAFVEPTPNPSATVSVRRTPVLMHCGSWQADPSASGLNYPPRRRRVCTIGSQRYFDYRDSAQ